MLTKSSLILTLLSAAVLLTACAASSTTKPAASREGAVVSDDAPIQAASATLTVHGMSCPLCANNVDQQLLDVPGVQNVKVDMGSGQVTVAFDATHRPTRAELADAVDRSGFTLVSLKTP